jgi:hypothetical protein
VQKRKKFILSQISRVKKVTLNSISNPHAGVWLDAIPKTLDMGMDNSLYRIALRFRYLLPIHELLNLKKCRCQRNSQNNQSRIDEYARHLVSGCACYGLRQYLHDKGLSNPIVRCASIAELDVRTELTFRHLEIDSNVEINEETAIDVADNRDADRLTLNPSRKGPLDCKLQQRPDIVMEYIDARGTRAKQIIELTVTDTLDGSKSGIIQLKGNQDTKVGVNCNRAYKMKMDKYGDKCRENEYEYKVITMETSGLIHPKSLRWIEDISKIASDKKDVPQHIMYKYMLKLISVSFQKAIGNLILKRISLHKRGLKFGDHDINELYDQEREIIRDHNSEFVVA